MSTYFTSDTHFSHGNILRYSKRPFVTIQEMGETLIQRWNSVVHANDTVYHIGDFVFGNYKQWESILKRLKGNIILIQGNHDRQKFVNRLVRDR